MYLHFFINCIVDLIGFISFNDAATAYNDTLIWASDDNVEALTEYITNL